MLYRYVMTTQFYDNGEASNWISCDEYPIEERTPCGAWIRVNEYKPYSKANRKWVSIGTRKAWAYPTKAEALNSLRQRVKWRCIHLETQLEKAKFSKKVLDKHFEAIADEATRSKTVSVAYYTDPYEFGEGPVFQSIKGF